MTFRNPIIGGAGALVREQVISPNFVSGSAGWRIAKDGSAEFNNVTIRGGTTTQGVILVYNGAPAVGNLIASVAPASGTDSFGNTYPQGISIQNGGILQVLATSTAYAKLVASAIGSGSAGLKLNPNSGTWSTDGYLSSFSNTSTPSVNLVSPWSGIGPSQGPSTLALVSGDNAGTAAPYGSLDTNFRAGGNVEIKGFAVAAKTDSSLYTWQTPTYNTNWAAATTFNGLTGYGSMRFRLHPDDTVEILGNFKAGAVLPANPVCTLPAGYRPASSWGVFCTRNNGGAVATGHAYISTSGNINIFAAAGLGIAVNNEYIIQGRYSLLNLA